MQETEITKDEIGVPSSIDALAVQNAVQDFMFYLNHYWQEIPDGAMPADVADHISDLVDKYAGDNTVYFHDRLNAIWIDHVCNTVSE